MKNALLISLFSTQLFATDSDLLIAKINSRIDELELLYSKMASQLNQLESSIQAIQHFDTWPQGYIENFRRLGDRNDASIYFRIPLPQQFTLSKYADFAKKYASALANIGGDKIHDLVINYAELSPNISGFHHNNPKNIRLSGNFTIAELESWIEQANSTGQS